MTPHVREAGAFFSYVTEGLGKRHGMGVAVVALIAYTAIELGSTGAWAGRSTTPLSGMEGPRSRGRCTPWSRSGSSRCWPAGTSTSAPRSSALLIPEVGVVLVLALVMFATGRADGINAQSFTPTTIMSGLAGPSGAVRADRLHQHLGGPIVTELLAAPSFDYICGNRQHAL